MLDVDWSNVFHGTIRFIGFALQYGLYVLVIAGFIYFITLIENRIARRRKQKTLDYSVDRDLIHNSPFVMLKPWNGSKPIALTKYYEEGARYSIEWYQMLELHEIAVQYNVDMKQIQSAIREADTHHYSPETALERREDQHNRD